MGDCGVRMIDGWTSTTRWCLTHDTPAGPRAYAYCYDIDAENFSNVEYVAEVKKREGCDIQTVKLTIVKNDGQAT